MSGIDFTIVAEGLRFPEGPIALADGTFLVVEICGQALTRISEKGDLTVIADLEGGPNGAAMGPDGWCYICNSGGWVYMEDGGNRRPIGQSARNGWIERVHLETGRVEKLYEAVNGMPLRSPNDIVFDAHGGFWFTDHGKTTPRSRDVTGIYYAKADGSQIEEVITGMVTPNGIGLSPDGSTLYVAETMPRRIWAFDVINPGKILHRPWPSLNGGRLVAGLEDANLLDSLAITADGDICVATLNNGGIWQVSPDGKQRRHTPLPDFYTTNICFGGPDMKTAYVTLSMSGRLAAMRWETAGLPLHHLNR